MQPRVVPTRSVPRCPGPLPVGQMVVLAEPFWGFLTSDTTDMAGTVTSPHIASQAHGCTRAKRPPGPGSMGVSWNHTAPPCGRGLASPVGWAVAGRGTELLPGSRESPLLLLPPPGPRTCLQESLQGHLAGGSHRDTLGQVGDGTQSSASLPRPLCSLGVAGFVGTAGVGCAGWFGS